MTGSALFEWFFGSWLPISCVAHMSMSSIQRIVSEARTGRVDEINMSNADITLKISEYVAQEYKTVNR